MLLPSCGVWLWWLGVCHFLVYCVKTAKHTAIVLWNKNKKPYPSLRMVPFPMTLRATFYGLIDRRSRAASLRQLIFLSVAAVLL